MLKKPDNTLIPLGTSNHEFDLTEKRIEEDSFKTIDIDKKGHFDLKRKYELIATWYDGYKVEVAKASRTFLYKKKMRLLYLPHIALLQSLLTLQLVKKLIHILMEIK